ncbi:hypothetical protein [Nonomuraea typhae]|uniref:hypothetical protein n=1 Tax=Nonomuraea typhae TaxID=2603600 RepID=UPI0012F95741|nr:hypothetical protein [Nonomuraea typhae]
MRRSLTMAAVMAATLLSATAPASASGNVPNCPAGNWCAYDTPYSVIRKSEGNWSGAQSFRYLVNNGNRDPGQDHIQVVWYTGSTRHSTCLHYYYDGSKENFSLDDEVPNGGGWVQSVTWRGEC